MMRTPRVLVWSLLVATPFFAVDSNASGVDPEQLGLHWGWSENTGWLTAAPDAPPGSRLELSAGGISGFLWSANLGWINAHCRTLDSCSDAAWGLELIADPQDTSALRLTGWLWSENVGWIRAQCADGDPCTSEASGLRVDRATGLVEGWLWGENIGWISLSCTATDSCAQTDFGLQFDPVQLEAPDALFRDGFEG